MHEYGSILLFPKAGSDVLQRTVVLHAVKSLVGGGRAERATVGYVGTELEVVERKGQHFRRRLPRAARIPACAERAAVLPTHTGQKGEHGIGVVVAAHQRHAGNVAGVTFDEGGEAFGGQFLAHIAAQIGTVATCTTIGTKREVDGERHLVGELLENNVIIDVFEHNESDGYKSGRPFAGVAGRTWDMCEYSGHKARRRSYASTF